MTTQTPSNFALHTFFDAFLKLNQRPETERLVETLGLKEFFLERETQSVLWPKLGMTGLRRKQQTLILDEENPSAAPQAGVSTRNLQEGEQMHTLKHKKQRYDTQRGYMDRSCIDNRDTQIRRYTDTQIR